MSDEDLGADRPGAVLAQARQTAGITQRDVSDTLHLPLHIVDAIERSDKTLLPAHVFTRGYIRAYAKLMDLDPDPLVTALTAEYGEDISDNRDLSTPSVSERSGIENLDLDRFLMPGAVVLGVLVITLVLWVFWPDGSGAENELEAGIDGQPDAVQNLEQSAPAITQDTDGRDVDRQAPRSEGQAFRPDSVIEDEGVTPGDTNVVLESDASDGPKADSNTPDAAVSETTSTPELTSQIYMDEITIVVREDCWIEVKRADGSLLYGDLGRSGSVIELEGNGPFSVLFGYAPGVDLEFNGERVALAPHTRNNVATFVIGQ
ncbi:MAG: RodZ domain-containing protein [Pseudomonadota bacterium]